MVAAAVSPISGTSKTSTHLHESLHSYQTGRCFGNRKFRSVEGGCETDQAWNLGGVSTARPKRAREALYWYGNGKMGDLSPHGQAQIGREHDSSRAVPGASPHLLFVDVVLSSPS